MMIVVKSHSVVNFAHAVTVEKMCAHVATAAASIVDFAREHILRRYSRRYSHEQRERYNTVLR